MNSFAPSTDNREWERTFYWISAAAVMGFAIHMVAFRITFPRSLDLSYPFHHPFNYQIITTMFLTVYAPSLALRGPLGSLTKAVEGLKLEQYTIIQCFVFLLVSFAVNILCSFWLVMRPAAAWASTTIFCVQAMGWYHHTMRIYNRFKFDAVDVGKDIFFRFFSTLRCMIHDTSLVRYTNLVILLSHCYAYKATSGKESILRLRGPSLLGQESLISLSRVLVQVQAGVR
jgi:hypothetical protein